ncbi:MAG: hypothetical protein WD875_07620 [Pirellulales bacterium]
MTKPHRSKALTATINRLARRFDGTANESGEIRYGSATIRVTTSATVADAVAELSQQRGPVYVAMTNREGVRDALRVADGTKVGVMQPDGEIVRPAEE